MNRHNGNAAPAVYVQTNDAIENEVLAFERRADGALAPVGRFVTGGRGTGEPHLASQSSIVLSDDGGKLLVVNAGSDELSLFVVEGDGLRLSDRVASGGATPTSVAVSGDLVYVSNNGTPSITGFRIELHDAVAGSTGLGEKGIRDEAITRDGRFLYAIDADAQKVFGWTVGANGELAPVGAFEGVPETVAGLAAS